MPRGARVGKHGAHERAPHAVQHVCEWRGVNGVNGVWHAVHTAALRMSVLSASLVIMGFRNGGMPRSEVFLLAVVRRVCLVAVRRIARRCLRWGMVSCARL